MRKQTERHCENVDWDKALGLDSGGLRIPWPELKRRAANAARKRRLDVEQILCNGSLEQLVAYSAKLAIEAWEGVPLGDDEDFLRTLGDNLANRLALRFIDGNDIATRQDALELALSFLYLFPRLWNALRKPLSLDEIRDLDFDELLSERRRASPRKTRSGSSGNRQR